MDYEAGVAGTIVTDGPDTALESLVQRGCFRGSQRHLGLLGVGCPLITILSLAPGRRARPYGKGHPCKAALGCPRLGQIEEVPGKAPRTTRRQKGYRAPAPSTDPISPSVNWHHRAGWQRGRSRAGRASTVYPAPANCHELHTCDLAQWSQPLHKLDRARAKGI